MQQIIHYFLHLLLPLFIALFFYKKKWLPTYLILLLTMLVDLDHLWATPLFDPCRCSMGFHPLHSYAAVGIYFLFLFFRKTRVAGIGLLLHMATDTIDCFMSVSNCQ